MSDVWKDEFEEKKRELLKKGWEPEKAEKEAENEVYHIYNLRRELLWDNVTKDVKKLPENLTNALKEIAELNPELKGILDRFNFLAFTSPEHREKLRMLLVKILRPVNFTFSEYTSMNFDEAERLDRGAKFV